MIYGYIRVSTDMQTVENQRFEINKFCERNGKKVEDWIAETISGAKEYSKRALGDLLKHVKKDDLIICAELSRLGRNLFMIMEILNICMRKECKVWTIKDNYRPGDDIQSKVLAFAFGLSAEGVILGRPKGRKTSPEKHPLYGKDELIKGLIKEGVSQNEIARICKVDRNTPARYRMNVPGMRYAPGWNEEKSRRGIEVKRRMRETGLIGRCGWKVTPENHPLCGKEEEIKRLRGEGKTWREVARMFCVDVETLFKYRKEVMKEDKEE